jgi:hypothetical protein
MGDEMKRRLALAAGRLALAAGRLALAAGLLAAAAPAQARAQHGSEAEPASQAVGADLFVSTDADDTEIVRAAIDLDLSWEGPHEYRGIRLEKAWFNPLGRGWEGRERIYLRAADRFGGWKWNGRLGTDGTSLLGAATLHNEAKLRQEYFIEREIVETPQGLARGLYYTYAGAALDVPADERNLFTLLAAVQFYSGDNVRTHVRASYIHVARPDWGLSVQLRTRLFHNSEPGEFDYYSPRWYAQLLPVVQLRRFSGGWRWSAAAGLGVQRDSASGWRRSSYLDARLASPPTRAWSFNAGLTYSETPTVAGFSYDYLQFTLGMRRAF